jgi:hypothetical protein
MTSELPARHLSRRDLATWLNHKFPAAHLAWADEIDNIFKAAGSAYMNARQPDMKAGQNRRILITAMSSESPLLRKYAGENLLNIIELASTCKLVPQGSIDICRRIGRNMEQHKTATKSSAVRKPKRKSAAVRDENKQFDDDDDDDETVGDNIIAKYGSSNEFTAVKREKKEDWEEHKPGSPNQKIILESPSSRHPERSPENHSISSVLCLLHLFSELQSGRNLASVAHHFTPLSRIADIIPTLHDYGVFSQRRDISSSQTIVHLLKEEFAVSIEHDRIWRKHLVVAAAAAAAACATGGGEASLRISVEDWSNAEQEASRRRAVRKICWRDCRRETQGGNRGLRQLLRSRWRLIRRSRKSGTKRKRRWR